MFRERVEHCLDNQGGFCGRNIIRLDETWNMSKVTIGRKGEVAIKNLRSKCNRQDLFWGMTRLTNVWYCI